METAIRAPAVAGDERAGIAAEDFDAIMRCHQKRVYRILWVLLRDHDAAGTLTQECFLRAYRKMSGFRGDSSLQTWLARIAVNLARDHLKSRRRRFWRGLVRDEEIAWSARDPMTPERVLRAREELQLVWKAADELTTNQRTAFLLRHVEGMSVDEVATVMRLRPGTVKSHLARALHALRERLRS